MSRGDTWANRALAVGFLLCLIGLILAVTAAPAPDPEPAPTGTTAPRVLP